MIERLDYISINQPAISSMFEVKGNIKAVDAGLRALIEVRISQINGCAHCVDTHLAEARVAGETQQRLDCLAVWRECTFFSAKEQAAFAWSEAVTLLPNSGAPQHLYDDLTKHFSDEEIVDLTLVVALMNAWNRLAVGFRHLPKRR